jgi:hypothetical protein
MMLPLLHAGSDAVQSVTTVDLRIVGAGITALAGATAVTFFGKLLRGALGRRSPALLRARLLSLGVLLFVVLPNVAAFDHIWFAGSRDHEHDSA